MNASALRFLLLTLLFSVSLGLSAQTSFLYELRNDIPVTVQGRALKAAWAGGLTSPQYSAADLDMDGHLDLVVFDRVDDMLLTFRNGGTPGEVDYTFAPEFMAAFPEDLTAWLLMKDFDADGYADIFTNLPGTSNIRVFRNTTGDNNGQLGFSIYADTLYTDYPPNVPLYSARSDFPAIVDVDRDGDLDILVFDLAGRDIEWHRNWSMENYGNPLQFEYTVQSNCFGHAREDIFTCEIIIGNTPCGPGQRTANPRENLRTGLHSGSTLTALNLNGDTLTDLLVGDVDCSNITALRNAGSLAIANFDYKEDDFPSNGGTIDIPVFPVTFHLDVNNDGVRDLIAASNRTVEIEDIRGSAYYRNQNTDDFPDFQLQRFGIFQEEMIETGTGAAPLFFDYNGDGRTDLLVGNLGRWDSLDGQTSSLQLFENTGTAQAPAFTLVDADYLGLSTSPDVAIDEYLSPAIGDLDNDGDPDLLLGKADGGLHYFRNDAAPGSPAQFNYQTGTYQNIDAGLYSAPELYDVDGDGDLDLLLGHHRGYVQFYRNTGSASLPNFVKENDTLGQIKVDDATGSPFSNGFSKPRMDDIDGDGKAELLVGNLAGSIEVFGDFSLVPGVAFTNKGDLFGTDIGGYATITAAVLDSAQKTYVVGTQRGGLMLFRNTGIVGASAPTPPETVDLKIFPNPARDRLTLALSGPLSGGQLSAEIWDLAGRRLLAQPMTGAKTEIDLHSLAEGMYIVQVRSRDLHLSRRVIVAR